jgi:hypothetical protein
MIRPTFAYRTGLHQHQLALDVLALAQVHELDHIDQLIELLGDLLDDFVGPRRHQCHTRYGGILGRCDRQGFDVIGSRGKQSRHA